MNEPENGERSDLDQVVIQQLDDWKKTQQRLQEDRHVMEEAAKTDKTGWFKRTGWLEHLKGRNLAHLGHQARLPERSETKLQLVAELTEQLIERCVRGLSTLPRETRRWLRSAEQTNIDPRPLARLQNPASQAKYANYMIRFVCYYLRILADTERRIEEYRSQQEQNEESSSEESEESEYEMDSHDGEYEMDSHDDEHAPVRRRRLRPRTSADTEKDSRELFPWKGDQKHLAWALWLGLDHSNREVQMEALLTSVCSFVLVSYGNDPYTSGLIHFAAVLGIDTETGRLRTAKNYSYMLAGLVYSARVLSVEKLLPATARDMQTEEDRDYFLNMRRRYLADGSYSPMSEMISLLAYGKHIAQAQGNSGHASWSKDRTIFYLNGRPMVIERFRNMAQSMLAEVVEQLWALCWVTSVAGRFTIDLAKVEDDVSFTKRGMSFVNCTGSRLSQGLVWMLERARSREGGTQLQSADGEWRGRGVRQYLRQVKRFLELLLGCVHVMSGQPGRGSEITTIRHRNGLLQDRNVFVVDGDVMTVTRYHKSQSQWDKPKVVPRFLPARLGQVMAAYLAYVQPFQEYLEVQVLGGHLTDYVWANKEGAWGTDRMTRVLRRETGKRLGVELRTLDYRHTAVGIGRVKVGDTFARGYEDEVGEVDEAEVDEDQEDIVELGNARSTAMGVSNYSVSIDIVKHLSSRSIDAFRRLSTAWHRFLGVDEPVDMEGRRALKRAWRESLSVLSVRPKEKQVRMGEREERERGVREERVRGEREERLMRAMQQVLGKEVVGFRSPEQEQAMHAVLDGETPLVVVLPTGGGKSLLFTVPGCMDGEGVTVVVVPYRALIEDLVRRIRASGVDCIEWKHGENNPATVVVVSADMAFISYAQLLMSKGLLRRVVIDECHLIITSSDWRPKLAGLKNLRLLPCPMVLLTATLPPVRAAELEAPMVIQGARYIRASTVRPNFRYLVSWCEAGRGRETAVAMCRRRVGALRARVRVKICSSCTGVNL